MPSPTTSALPHAPRPPWRGLALLTLAVVVVHLALLVLAPASIGPPPSPLENKFITRTIVIAPPPAMSPPAASDTPAASPPAAAKPPPPAHRPPRPHAATSIPPISQPAPAQPTPSPEPDRTAQIDTPAQDLTEQPAIDARPEAQADAAAQTPPPPAAPAAPVATDAPSASAGGQTGQAAKAGDASGDLAGGVPMRIPGSVKLSFAATGQQGASPMQGVFGELAWLQDGKKYDARLSLTFLFRTIRTQHSTGVIGNTGIEPERFSETRKTEVASHFVRDQSTVVFSNNAPSVRLLAGAQDRLSVVMQLGALLAGDPARYPAGAIIAVQTVGPRDGDIWTFNVEGDETLNLPAGDFATRKLTRNPRKPFDDKVELWVAPELGYLPVRIKQTQTNGDFADLQLRSLTALKP